MVPLQVWKADLSVVIGWARRPPPAASSPPGYQSLGTRLWYLCLMSGLIPKLWDVVQWPQQLLLVTKPSVSLDINHISVLKCYIPGGLGLGGVLKICTTQANRGWYLQFPAAGCFLWFAVAASCYGWRALCAPNMLVSFSWWKRELCPRASHGECQHQRTMCLLPGLWEAGVWPSWFLYLTVLLLWVAEISLLLAWRTPLLLCGWVGS